MIVADHPLPLILQTRIWRLGTAYFAALSPSEPYAPLGWRVAPVLDGDGVIVDVVEAPVGDEELVWEAATWLSGHPRSDRLNWSRWFEERWLVHMAAGAPCARVANSSISPGRSSKS